MSEGTAGLPETSPSPHNRAFSVLASHSTEMMGNAELAPEVDVGLLEPLLSPSVVSELLDTYMSTLTVSRGPVPGGQRPGLWELGCSPCLGAGNVCERLALETYVCGWTRRVALLWPWIWRVPEASFLLMGPSSGWRRSLAARQRRAREWEGGGRGNASW